MARAGDVFFRMDLRCSGRIPLGPAADPFGKERAAERTSAELKTLADMVETGGGGLDPAGRRMLQLHFRETGRRIFREAT